MELAQLPELTRGEEAALVRRARVGDNQARRELVESCLEYVMRIAPRYAERAGLDLLDVVQAGNLALVQYLDAALAAPNPCAHLRKAARGIIINYCREYTSIIRTPRTKGTRAIHVKSLDAPLYDDDEVTLADLIEA